MSETIKKYAGEMREAGFLKIAELAPLADGSHIVETGCIRTWPDSPDGASTVILASLAKDTSKDFTSVDITEAHVARAKQALEETGFKGDVITSDSLAVLRQCYDISVLYLDSFDYNPENHLQCQRHAMAELGAAWGGLAEKCVVAMDDWNDTDGGKTGLVIPFLLDNGFKAEYEGYIRVFSRGL